MNLDEAVGNVTAAGPHGSEARRLVGAHLAVEAGLQPGAMVLGLGVWGLELIEGARAVAAGLRRCAVSTQLRSSWRGGVDLVWMAKPPGDQPLVIFAAVTITGGDVVAVLDDLRRDGLPPVILCTTRARTTARTHIRERHPELRIVTPNLHRAPASLRTGRTPS